MLAEAIKGGLEWLTQGQEIRIQLEMATDKGDQVPMYLNSCESVKAIMLALLNDEFAANHDTSDLLLTEGRTVSLDDGSPLVYFVKLAVENEEWGADESWVQIDLKPRVDQMSPAELWRTHSVS